MKLLHFAVQWELILLLYNYYNVSLAKHPSDNKYNALSRNSALTFGILKMRIGVVCGIAGFICRKLFPHKKRVQLIAALFPITFFFRFQPKLHLCQARFQMKRRLTDRLFPFPRFHGQFSYACPICLLESYPLLSQ